MSTAPRSAYRDRRAVVTGGLGFIGSNLAIALVRQGARVTVLDCRLAGHGGNLFNVEPVRLDLEVILGDVRDEERVAQIVRGADYVFHLAGQNDHVLGLSDPYPDIDINIRGSLVLLEACRRHASDARLVYTGTRGEYGAAITLPVSEDAGTDPKGLHELSKLTAQRIFRIYQTAHGLRSAGLRLANIYGERAQMQHGRFGVANLFIRRAIEGETIQIYGDGKTLRDFVYVGDAVEAILGAAAADDAYGQIFNVGNDAPATFLELAQAAVAEAGVGGYELVPFSPERAKVEPGDFYSDISKIQRLTGWRPTTSLAEGVRRTVAYYRQHREHYW